MSNEVRDIWTSHGRLQKNKRPSEIWKAFDKEIQPDKTTKAKCKRCKKGLNYSVKGTGSNNLWGHYESHLARDQSNNREISGNYSNHSEYDHQGNQEHFLVNDHQNNQEHYGFHDYNPLRYDQQRDQAVNHLGCDQQHTDSERSGNEINHLGYDQQENRRLFARMAIASRGMLGLVENPFLEEFARLLEPLYMYSPVTQREVEEDCFTFYQNEKSKLKDKIKNLTSKVSLSIGKCYGPRYYIATHFINNDYKLIKIIIGLLHINIKFQVEKVLNDWGLGDKVIAGSVNFGGSRDLLSSFTNLDEMCRVECFRTFINAVVDCLYLSIDSKVRGYIEKTMRDVKSCPEQMCQFNQIAMEHNLPPLLEFANNKGVLGSQFNNLIDACTYENVLSAFIDEDVPWSEVKEIVNLINAINDETMELSFHEHERPTSNLLLKFVFGVREILEAAYTASSSPTKGAIAESFNQLDTYLATYNKIILIASLLDPRFKLEFLERCLGKFIDNKEEFFEFLNGLYNKYQGDSTETSRSARIPELVKYLESGQVNMKDPKFDVLDWWKRNEKEYPILSKMVRDILAIPISSSLTSATNEPQKEIIDEIFDSTIDAQMFEVLPCTNNWLTSNQTADMFEASIESTVEKRHFDQACPQSSNKGNRISSVYDQKKCGELLAKLVIASKLPFQFVSNTWFIQWTKNLLPSYIPIDVATVRTYCLRFYQIERRRLQNDIRNHVERCCFSTHTFGFKAYVTIHYIDNNFKLVRRVIGVKAGTDKKDWAIEIKKCIASWVLHKEVLAFTCDQSNSKGKEVLDRVIQVDCIVNGLFNQLWEAIFVEFGSLFDSIRKMTKYLADRHMDHRTALKLDNSARWDFTLNMLSCALENKNDYDTIEDSDVVEQFTSGGWIKVEIVVSILKPIYEAVVILSSSKKSTSNLFLKMIFDIHDAISHAALIRNNDCGKLEPLWEHIGEYFKGCNKILLVASLLDPRFKMTYLQRCYEEHIFDGAEVDKYTRELYKSYELNDLSHGGDGQLGMSELERYLQEAEVKDADYFDILRWWNDNKSDYPILSRMARDILAIPVSAVSSELAFDCDHYRRFEGIEKRVNQLGPCTMESLMCSHNWLSDARLCNGKQVENRTTIDLVRKHIPPSYKSPLRVCDIWCLNYFKYGLESLNPSEKKMVTMGCVKLSAEQLLECLMWPIDKEEPDKWIPAEVLNCYIRILNYQGSSSDFAQQEDGDSCGLFARKYMEFCKRSNLDCEFMEFCKRSNLDCEFTQDDINMFRKKIVGQLIFSDLNENEYIQDEVRIKVL